MRYQPCIDSCNACADACDTCAGLCLKEPDVHNLAACIALNVECAAFCRVAAACMARGGAFVDQICELCAKVCTACGRECERHQGMAHCQQCARACYECAERCRGLPAGRRGTVVA